jgi:CRP/FNR family cyclic AMP-dependent transcriptional regulator
LFITTEKEVCKAGDIIFKEGTHGVAVYVLKSGKVEISKAVENKKVVLDLLGPGDIFGEMSFLDNAPRSATAIALEETVVELIDKDFLDREFNQIASDFRGIVIALVRRLRKTTRDFVAIPGRKEERVSAKIRISFKKANDFIKAYIANLGSGGLFINTEKFLPVGSFLNLEFNLPDSSKVILTQGKVAWTRPKDSSTQKIPPGMGIEFIKMSPEDKQALDNYLERFRSL